MIKKVDLMSTLLQGGGDVCGVDKRELTRFTQSMGLDLRKDHQMFLLNYGESISLLTSTFADCTYKRFKEYNLNYKEHLEGDLPLGTVYFGHDFSDESLCIENDTGNIYIYDSEEIDLLLYENIESFLLFSILFHAKTNGIFKKIQSNIKVDDVEKFKYDNDASKIDGISTFYYEYFLKGNQLIALNFRNGFLEVYEGGILDRLN